MSEKITEHELRQRFPKASEHFIRLNARIPARSSGAPAKSQRSSGGHPLAAHQDQKARAGTLLVRVIDIRKRMLDDDNAMEKYLVDSLRYAGFIPNDKPPAVRIQTLQRKADKGEAERTIIEVWKIN